MAAAQKAAVIEQGLRSEIVSLQEALQRAHAARYQQPPTCLSHSRHLPSLLNKTTCGCINMPARLLPVAPVVHNNGQLSKQVQPLCKHGIVDDVMQNVKLSFLCTGVRREMMPARSCTRSCDLLRQT